jgi:hypothetical protein
MSERAKPTPGPWVALPPPEPGGHWAVCARGDRPPPARGAVGWVVATVENGAAGDTLETEAANARLISAAPDLLRACEAWLAHLDPGDSLYSEAETALIRQTRAAVAKAAGG